MNKSELVIDLKAIDGFSKVFKNMESPLNSFMSQMKKLDNNTNFDKLKLNLNSVSKYVLKLSKDLDNATTNNKKKWNDFNKSLFNGFNEVTRPFDSINNRLGNIFNSGLFLADDLNTNMNRISAITHLTNKEFDSLKNKAESTATSIGTSTAQFSKLMLTSVRSGVQSIDGLVNSSKLGSMFGKDLNYDPAESLKSIVRVTHAYGEKEDKFTDSADLMVWLKEISGSDMGEINTGLANSAPVAKSFNLPKVDLASIYAQMALGGVEGSKAGTSIKNMLYGTISPKTLLNLTKNDSKFADTLKEDGITVTYDAKSLDKWTRATKVLGLDENKIWQKGKLQFFEYLVPKLQLAQKKLEPNIYGESLRNMFGKEGIAGITKMAASAENGGTDIFKTHQRMQKYQGQTSLQFKFYQNSYRGKLDKLSGEVDNFKEKLASSGILDLAIKFVGKLGNIMERVGTFSKQHPSMLKWVAGFGLFALAGFKVLGMIAKVAEGIFAIKKVFEFSKLVGESQKLKTLKKAFSFFSKFKNIISIFSKFKSLILGIGRGLALFAISNPIALAITATVALIATAGYLIYKNWDKIKIWLYGAWDSFKGLINSGLEILTKAFDKIYGYYIKIKGKVFGDNNEIKGIPDQIDITKKEIQKLEPISLYVPKSNAEMNQLTSKSIIDINFNNAPKDLSVSSATKGNNPTKLNISNMGFQDLAYE
ncbi:MAG: phage tail tape measure protein [Silvanigrellaceae bacterium]|nr:phage tail tape measure protein [Silvanigrellaceae bacterium]